jgi:hypothetical protein
MNLHDGNLLESYLKTVMTLPILGPDTLEGYKKALNAKREAAGLPKEP